jgi:predicted ATPase
MEISGLEDEFDLSIGMPRLLYLKQPAPDIEPGLTAMIARLETGDSASYKLFRDADELHDLLLDDLAILLAERFAGRPTESAPEPRLRHNLPAQASTFLGREAELRDLHDVIGAQDVRLTTLTGPGGTGKTRLAIQAAAGAVERFADGVFFADLSAERGVDEAFAALARSLGVTVVGEARPLDALKAELRHRQVLLVLDNFEQVMAAAVGVVELLEHCPAVRAVVTSREGLRVRGERIFPVSPLSLPGRDGARSAGDSEAVRLFCDRAAAMQPGFRISEGNAAAIAAICRHLDGLPLAIELAAARTQLFDVDDLRRRLENQLDVLRGGARDLPKRQQTLRDAIAWSYDLLDPAERRLLCLFAVFSSARLRDVEETARRVPGFEDVDVIEVVGSLVDKSLVTTSPGSDGAPRFSMLRTIRTYAWEQLNAIPELAPAARVAHAEQYGEVAFRLQQQMPFAARSSVLSALADELGNMRAAWDEWVDRMDVARLNGLLGPLWGYYDARGDYRSAIELGQDLLDCLAATPDTPERRRDEFAVRMSVVRTELVLRGYRAEAEHLIRDAMERAEVAGDARQRFPGLRSLGYLQFMRSNFEQTVVIARELTAIAEKEHDPLLLSEAHLFEGLSRGWRVALPAALDQLDKAVEYAEAAPSGHVDFRVGPQPAVVTNVVLGLTQWLTGSPGTGLATMQRALQLAIDLDHPYSVAYALHHAGLLDLWEEDLASLAARAEALLMISEVHDYPVWRALSLVLGGVSTVMSGEAAAGLERVEEGFQQYMGLSTPPVFWPGLLAIRATAFGAGHHFDRALAVIQEAEAALQPGDPQAPYVGVVHGRLLLAAQPPDASAAEAAFEQAAHLARGCGAKMAHMQALTWLANLRRGTAGGDRSRRTLQELYDSFTEGFDRPHLVAARAALEA